MQLLWFVNLLTESLHRVGTLGRVIGKEVSLQYANIAQYHQQVHHQDLLQTSYHNLE